MKLFKLVFSSVLIIKIKNNKIIKFYYECMIEKNNYFYLHKQNYNKHAIFSFICVIIFNIFLHFY